MMEAKWIHVLLLGALCFSAEARRIWRHEYPDVTPSSTPDFTPSSTPDFTPSSTPDFTPSSTLDVTPSTQKRYSKNSRYFLDDGDMGNANDYVDATLENLRKEPEISKHLNPLRIPDIDQGNYNVRNMKIHGLLSLYRHGDCSLTYNGDTVNVVAEVAVNDVSITMDYSANAWIFSINGDGEIGVDHLAVRLDFSSTNGYAKLNSLKVVNLGNYSVKRITGLNSFFNWLLKIIANIIAQSARQIIINALENEAGKALGNLLKQYKLPIL